jgi:hypothetical protein
MNYITRKHLSRRALLRASGAALALPLLESMTPAMAQALAPRLRLACIYVPHGVTMDKWTPTADGSNFPMSEILLPLEAFRSHLTVVSDLELPAAYGADSSAEANHTRSSACFLSGANPLTGALPKLGITVDQVAARYIGQDTALPSLELGIEEPAFTCGTGFSCAYRNTISWQTDTSPLPVEINPQVVFERLFGDGATEQQRLQRRATKQSLLDNLRAEIAALDASLPATDRQRLEQYLEDVREIERRLANAANGNRVDLDAPVGIPGDFDAHVKLQLDLLALAWQSDTTRIGTLLLAQETSNASYPASGVSGGFHGNSHHSNVRANMENFAVLNRYHVGILGYFLEKLAQAPENAGSLLDNAMILYGSGISDGNQHNHEPLPVLLAGRAGGSLTGNRHVRAPAGTPLANLQVDMLHKLGVPVDSFGDSTGVFEI